MRESAARYQQTAQSFNARAAQGAITQSDLNMMRAGLDKLYESHMALYRLLQSNVSAELLAVAGIEPPVRESIPAPAGSGLRGLPAAAGAVVGAEALAAAGTLFSWIAGVIAAVVTSEAFLVIFGVSAVAYLIYTVFIAQEDTRRIEQSNSARQQTFDRCLQAGGTIDHCTEVADRLNPPPPSAAGAAGEDWFAKGLEFGKVALGLGALGIGAYFAVNLFGGGRGGSGGVVIINPGTSTTSTTASGGGGGEGVSPGLVIGTVLVGAIGYLWWQAGQRSAPRTSAAPTQPATRPTGNLRSQLFGRGEFSRDAAQSLSYDQFVGRRGPQYNLEVGR
jgi:predicted phage tail protein